MVQYTYVHKTTGSNSRIWNQKTIDAAGELQYFIKRGCSSDAVNVTLNKLTQLITDEQLPAAPTPGTLLIHKHSKKLHMVVPMTTDPTDGSPLDTDTSFITVVVAVNGNNIDNSGRMTGWVISALSDFDIVTPGTTVTLTV